MKSLLVLGRISLASACLVAHSAARAQRKSSARIEIADGANRSARAMRIYKFACNERGSWRARRAI
jgi:hypothetical protein